MKQVMAGGYSFEIDAEKTPTIVAYACGKCHDTGYLIDGAARPGDPTFSERFPCVCRIKREGRERAEKIVAASGMANMSEWTFGSFEPRGDGKEGSARFAKSVAERYVRGELSKPWLLFYGPYASGKTHLSVAIANYWMRERGEAAIFGTVPDLIDTLRGGYRDHTYNELMAEMRSVSLLVFDEYGLGNTDPGSNEYRLVYQILNYRYNQRLHTVITTNHEPNDLEPRMRSRVLDKDRCRRVLLKSNDSRIN